MFSSMQTFRAVACCARRDGMVLLRLPDDDVAEAWVGQDLSNNFRLEADKSSGRRTDLAGKLAG